MTRVVLVRFIKHIALGCYLWADKNLDSSPVIRSLERIENFPVFIVSQLSSAQNNSYSKIACFGMTYSDAFNILNSQQILAIVSIIIIDLCCQIYSISTC